MAQSNAVASTCEERPVIFGHMDYVAFINGENGTIKVQCGRILSIYRNRFNLQFCVLGRAQPAIDEFHVPVELVFRNAEVATKKLNDEINNEERLNILRLYSTPLNRKGADLLQNILLTPHTPGRQEAGPASQQARRRSRVRRPGTSLALENGSDNVSVSSDDSDSDASRVQERIQNRKNRRFLNGQDEDSILRMKFLEMVDQLSINAMATCPRRLIHRMTFDRIREVVSEIIRPYYYLTELSREESELLYSEYGPVLVPREANTSTRAALQTSPALRGRRAGRNTSSTRSFHRRTLRNHVMNSFLQYSSQRYESLGQPRPPSYRGQVRRNVQADEENHYVGNGT